MSHVKALIERLENKIKEQSGSSSAAPPAAAKQGTGSASKAALPPAAKAAPRTVIFTSPEEFLKNQKETEAKERQNKDQAKQMAARYNLTYRTLELKAQKEEEKAAAAAISAGAPPPLPSRRRASLAARRQSMVNKPVGGATVVAPPRRASMMAKLPSSTAGSTAASTTSTTSTTNTTSQEAKVDVSIPNDGYEVYNAVEADAFWMTELALALAYEDEGGINRAILLEFFEEHDPDRIGEVDQLLKDWEGKEDELFAHISLTYMDKQGTQANGKVDDSAERAAFAVFEAAVKEADEDDEELKKAIAASLAEDSSSGSAAAAATTAGKPRRTSVISKVVLSQQGGVQAAEIASIPLLDIDVEEKTDDFGAGAASSAGAGDAAAPPPNHYIISGIAQDGQAWKVNTHGEGDNKILRDQMLATGHTEEEVKAVIQEQSGLL